MFRLIGVSLVFGVYASLVGIAFVFLTLLAVAAASVGMRRLLGDKTEAQPTNPQKRMRVAAMAAVHCYIDVKEVSPPRLKVEAGESLWSAVARVEALRIRGGVLDEA